MNEEFKVGEKTSVRCHVLNREVWVPGEVQARHDGHYTVVLEDAGTHYHVASHAMSNKLSQTNLLPSLILDIASAYFNGNLVENIQSLGLPPRLTSSKRRVQVVRTPTHHRTNLKVVNRSGESMGDAQEEAFSKALQAAGVGEADFSSILTSLRGKKTKKGQTCPLRLCLTEAFPEDPLLSGPTQTILHALPAPHKAKFTLDLEDSKYHSLPRFGFGELFAKSGKVEESEENVLSAVSLFPTVVPYCVWMQEGTFYFEVDVVKAGLAQLGWMDSEAQARDATGMGCGDTSHSWAFDGSRVKKWNKTSEDYGEAWSEGDVVGCYVCVTKREVSRDGDEKSEKNEEKKKKKLDTPYQADIGFTLNGQDLGLAFEKQPFHKAIRPAITMNASFTCKVHLSDFSYPYKDAQGVQAYVDACVIPVPTIPSKHLPAKLALNLTPSPSPPPFSPPPTLQTLLHIHHACSSSPGYVSQKLTNKLLQQLKDPLSVCANALPSWCYSLPSHFPFLFPLYARASLFKATSFGLTRGLYAYLMSTPKRETSLALSSIGLTKMKAVVNRHSPLPAARKILQDRAIQQALLHAEFQNEIGHGLGPTAEFYSLLCRGISMEPMWRGTACVVWKEEQGLVDVGGSIEGSIETAIEGSIEESSQPLSIEGSSQHSLGENRQETHKKDKARHETQMEEIPLLLKQPSSTTLYPLLIPPSLLNTQPIQTHFRFLGRVLAKALLDDRLLDLNLSLPFCKALVDVALEPADLELVDKDLFASLAYLKTLDQEEISQADLYFTLPGDDAYELGVGGKDRRVQTRRDVLEYVHLVEQACLGIDVQGMYVF